MTKEIQSHFLDIKNKLVLFVLVYQDFGKRNIYKDRLE